MTGYLFCGWSNTRHIWGYNIKPLLESDNLMSRLKTAYFLIPCFNVCKQ